MINKNNQFFASTTKIIQEAKNGKIFILVDDEERENEGDLVILADLVTANDINFMITHGRGLPCLAIEKSIADKFNLKLQERHNVSKNYTAFTTSVEARFGITTGISAKDRCHTIKTMIDKNSSAKDIMTPGHVFPIIAHQEGLLSRQGHTEASVAIAKLAGFTPAAVICEILNKDGLAATRDELIIIAKEYQLLIGTIENLINDMKKMIS